MTKEKLKILFKTTKDTIVRETTINDSRYLIYQNTITEGAYPKNICRRHQIYVNLPLHTINKLLYILEDVN